MQIIIAICIVFIVTIIGYRIPKGTVSKETVRIVTIETDKNLYFKLILKGTEQCRKGEFNIKKSVLIPCKEFNEYLRKGLS